MNFNKHFLGLALVVTLCFPVSAKQQARAISIIPTPNEVVRQNGQFTLPKSIVVSVNDASLNPAGEYLGKTLSGAAKTSVQLNAPKSQIKLNIGGDVTTKGAYTLTCDASGVAINAADYEGIINGIASLRQLLPPEVGYGQKTSVALTVPYVAVKDAPRFGWRGLMLDSSRHWWTIGEVKRLIDLMVLYKLNVFHWHLVDDQGWRVEIKRYPELTEKGSFRKFNNLDVACDQRAAAEHNPDMRVPRDRMKVVDGDSVYGGYYTQDQLRDVVKYAQDRGITIVPEIDMPGHGYTTTVVEPFLTCDGKPNSSLCPGKNTTLEFCKNVYKEIFDIFPSKYVFIGADEVNKENWTHCKDCAKRMKDEGFDSVDQLQGWFVRQMELFFRLNGRHLMGWDEITRDGLSSDAAIMWWRSDPKDLQKATADGKRVTCSPTSCVYFDYGQDDSSVSHILAFDPLSMGLDANQQKLVMGMQANIWGEFIPSMDRIEYMIMPRMMALSESAWTSPKTRLNDEKFWATSQQQFLRLDAMDVNYRIPDFQGVTPNRVFVGKATLKPYTNAKNCVIRYTTDGSIPTAKSKAITKPLVISKDCKITLASFRPNGKRSEMIYNFVKSTYVPALNVNPTADGLKVLWYKNKVMSQCSEIDKAPLRGELVANGVTIPAEVTSDKALVFTGYVLIPVDGVYSFALTSDDGSYLMIDGRKYLDNDQLHGPATVYISLPLRKGFHKIDARYFDWNDNGGRLDTSIINVDDPTVKVSFKH
jgi:hexosaminidase